MSAEQENGPPAPFRLQTLGTPSPAGPERDAAGSDFAQQGRRLALLGALATAGERGRNRDQLLLFFWPDASQERARHSLEQTLYLIRRSLDPSVFVGVNPLRLNPVILESDVEEFESAIEAGDFEAAVELYRGPFLDGFYLSDAPEFEQWMEGERSRLEGLYMKALERLAEAAEAGADHSTAVGWWRRLADVDPLSSRPALGVMRGLANAGDHAAALRHARHYERIVEQELGTGAGPEVASVAEEIRASAREAVLPAKAEPEVHGESTPTVGRPPPPVRSGDREPGGEVALTVSRTVRKPRMGIVYVAVAVLLVAAFFVVTRLGREPAVPGAAEAVEPSIAVLPLSNLSTDPRDAVLADGMTEELIAMLSKTGDLRVIASTSAFAFRDRQADVRTIADSLGVSNVLEGGVRRDGPRLRVHVRLVDARDGSTRWSETYDRQIEDLLVVQEEIASAVARELGARLGGRGSSQLSRHRTGSVAAYELYLRGSDPALLRSDSGPHQGLEYFRQAIAIDSTFAAAWAGLARMYGMIARTDDPGMPIEDLLALSEQAARKAIALDDSLAEAHATFGMLRLRQDRDYATAEIELRRAVELDPAYGRAREWLVLLYLATERPVEALAAARRALEIDPLSPSAHAELAHALLANDRPDEALVHLERIASVRPPLLRTAPLVAQAYGKKGMWAEAVEALEPTRTRDSGSLAFYAYFLARAGRREEALRMREELLQRWRGDARAVDIAMVYAGLGDFDQAFAWIERSSEFALLQSTFFTFMEPIFEDLRRDPRFDRVRERLGLQKR